MGGYVVQTGPGPDHGPQTLDALQLGHGVRQRFSANGAQAAHQGAQPVSLQKLDDPFPVKRTKKIRRLIINVCLSKHMSNIIS